MAERRDEAAETKGKAGPSPYSHDAIFKRTFSVPEHALDLMRRQLPQQLVDALDPGSLREESGTFIDDALKESRSDVLFSATVRGGPVLVYVLIEHQGSLPVARNGMALGS